MKRTVRIVVNSDSEIFAIIDGAVYGPYKNEKAALDSIKSNTLKFFSNDVDGYWLLKTYSYGGKHI